MADDTRPVTRRQFLRLSAASAAVLTLAACGSSPTAKVTPTAASGAGSGVTPTAAGGGASSTSGTLTFWGWEGTVEGVKSQLNAFKQKYPNLKVDVKLFGYDDIHTNLLNAIVAGTGAPDLCSIDVLRLTQYVDGLADFTSQRAKYDSQFVPPVMDLGSYKGKFYGLVTDSEPIGVIYRTDLWDKYGVKEADMKTWDDLAAAGDEVSSKSGGKVKLYSMTANDPAVYEIMAIQQGFGGYYFDDTDTKVIVDDPKIIQAVTALAKLWNSKGCAHVPNGPYGDETKVLLKNGKSATQIVGAGWSEQDLITSMPETKGKWRLMRPPAVSTGGKRDGYQYPTILVIPKQSKLQSAAWDLEVMGLTGGGASALYDKYGILPAYAPLFDKLKDKPIEFFGGQKVLELYEEIAKDCPKVFYGTGFTEAQSILGNHLPDILNGKVTPEAGMKAAAQEMRTKLKKS